MGRCGPRCEFHARAGAAPPTGGPPGRPAPPARGRKPSDDGLEMPRGPPCCTFVRTATAERSLSSTATSDSSFCICFFGGACRGAVWCESHCSNSFCASSRSSFRTSARDICSSSFWTKRTNVGMESRSGCASTSDMISGAENFNRLPFMGAAGASGCQMPLSVVPMTRPGPFRRAEQSRAALQPTIPRSD